MLTITAQLEDREEAAAAAVGRVIELANPSSWPPVRGGIRQPEGAPDAPQDPRSRALHWALLAEEAAGRSDSARMQAYALIAQFWQNEADRRDGLRGRWAA